MTTPHILFEQLENSGYIKGNSVALDKIQRATLTELTEVAKESAVITSAEHFPREQGAFAHSASLSLGGGMVPCRSLHCRLQQVEELSQFAALYSDRVYIHNFLSNFAVHYEGEHNVEEGQLNFGRSLEVLLRLRPLIEAGRVLPITAPEGWCVHCFGVKVSAENHIDAHMRRGLTSAGEYLRKRFLSEAKITVKMEGGEYIEEVRAPEDLIEHGFHAHISYHMPRGLEALPDVRSLLLRGRAVTLSRRQQAKYGIHEDEAALILRNVLFELTVSQTFGTSFLTERPIHIKILQSLTESTQQEKRNDLIRKHLTTLVPYLDGVDPAELLKLRELEGDSFLIFRQALNHAIDEASDKTGEFTERHARELYGDILEPSLARLDLKLRGAQKSLVRTAARKTSAMVGAISFGLFTGLLPAGVAAMAKALGLTKVLADLGESALQAQGDENLIRGEDMYFLWKVRQRAR